jgi:hypothetical protein
MSMDGLYVARGQEVRSDDGLYVCRGRMDAQERRSQKKLKLFTLSSIPKIPEDTGL